METVDQFIARGGRPQILANTDRALTCPNREFSIVIQGQRERKQAEERHQKQQKVAIPAR